MGLSYESKQKSRFQALNNNSMYLRIQVLNKKDLD